MERIDTAVIGAGVVGLAVARALAAAGREVVVMEAGPRMGEGISSRNSGVIHAGLYYLAGSLKARFCNRGRELLYAYCAERGIDHRQLGKWVVAGSEMEMPRLRALADQAQRNGVPDLRWLDGDEIHRSEPELQAVAALASPRTGIVDVPALVLALAADVEAAGGVVVLDAKVVGGAVTAGGMVLELEGADEAVLCGRVINCAGLGAWTVAAALGVDARRIPGRWLAAGAYFSYSGQVPFSRLIYPLHSAAGLGVHLTFDLAGRARFGPDVEWLGGEDYKLDDGRKDDFLEAISHYWPGVQSERLQPDFVGIRPKIAGPGMPAADFLIDGPEAHGVPGLINLFGIESPGLTSALAIGEYVAALAEVSG